jgi:hypothetical protein
VGSSAVFIRNTLALNDTGVGLFTNAPILFVENAMIENFVQVEALSGALQLGGHSTAGPPASDGSAADNPHAGHSSDSEGENSPWPTFTELAGGPIWSIGGQGNYWSDYSGYDANDDGVGDQPYRPEPAFAGALSDNPNLRLFQFTLAQEAIDVASEMFPVYQYDPVLEDTAPLMAAPGPALPEAEGMNGSLLAISIVLVAAALVVVQFAFDFDPVEALLRRGKRLAGLTGGAS